MKYFSKFSILLLFAVFMFASSAMAIDRYVAPPPVGDNGTGNGTLASPWATIQFAIDNSVANDVINVAAGTYNENVTVNKKLTITGANKNTTIIDANGSGTVVTITVDEVVFEGFTVQNSQSGNFAGIAIYGADNAEVDDCIVKNNSIGIAIVENANSNEVSYCTIENNTLRGVLIDYAVSNASSSTQNIVTYNSISGSAVGVYLGETASDNDINNNQIFDNTVGIELYDSDDNSFSYNNIYENQNRGIRLGRSSNNTFTNETLTGTASTQPEGLVTATSGGFHSTGNAIYSSKITGHTLYGVHASGDPANAIEAENNWWGAASGPYNDDQNLCGEGNAISANVVFRPFYNSVDMDDVFPTYSAPSTQARFIGFTNVSATEMNVSAFQGNGVGRIFVIRTDNDFDDTDDYLLSTGYDGSGSPDGSWGNKVALGATDSYVIAQFTTNNNYILLTGLTASTEYWVKVYEFGCFLTGDFVGYQVNNSTMNPRNRTTLPPTAPTVLPATHLASDLFFANWSFGSTLGANDIFQIEIYDGTDTDLWDIGNYLDSEGNPEPYEFPVFYFNNAPLQANTAYQYRVRAVINGFPTVWSAYNTLYTFTADMAIEYAVDTQLDGEERCHNGNNSLGVDVTTPLWGATTTYTYLWSASPVGAVTFSDNAIENPTATYVNTTTDPITATVSVFITDNTGTGNSGTLTATITITPATQAPTITQTAPEVCEEGLILLSFTDGVGDFVSWEYSSDDANWFELTSAVDLGSIFNLTLGGNDVSFDGSNFLTIDNATALIHNLYFRVVFDDACGVEEESASVQLKFFATTVARNIIAADLSIDLCEGENVSIQPEAATPVGEYVRWEYSVNGSAPWHNVEDATNGLVAQGYVTSVAVQSGGATTYRRLDLTEVDNTADGLHLRIVYVHGPCDEDESDTPAVLNVSPTPLLGFSFNSVLADTDDHFYYCEDETVSVTLSDVWAGTGPFNIAWEVREDNSAGASIPALSGSGTFSATNALFGPLTLDPGTYYVEITSIEDDASNCTFDLSGDNPYVAYVTVNPTPVVGFSFNGDLAVTDSEFDYCEGETVTVTLSHIWGGVGPFDVEWEVYEDAGYTTEL